MGSRLSIYLPILFTLLIFSACDKKQEGQKRAPKESVKVLKRKKKSLLGGSFRVSDIDNRTTRIHFEDAKVLVDKVIQPIVIIHLFAPWCPPCRGMLPYLSEIQRKYARRVFVIGIVVNSSIGNEELRRFMQRYDATFFISNAKDNDRLARCLAAELSLPENYPIPLTLVYKNGERVIDIEGAAPQEMLENIIEQLK